MILPVVKDMNEKKLAPHIAHCNPHQSHVFRDLPVLVNQDCAVAVGGREHREVFTSPSVRSI